MEKYVELLQKYLSGKRNFTKTMFKIAGTIYRGATKGRFTYEEGMAKLDALRGVTNVSHN